MTASVRSDEVVAALRHLMAPHDSNVDFTMPSLLRDVPSFNSSDSTGLRAVLENAQLGRSAPGDR